jgi:hypothetical protein
MISLIRASMSGFLPAPLTMVVFSFSIVGFLTHGERDVLELDAEVFADRPSAGQIPMSCGMAYTNPHDD